MTPKFKSTQDLRQFENFFKAVKTLDFRQVTYGFYDDPHYSGLNTATLAAIHQEGWNGLPARSFMTSASIAFQKDLKRFQKELFGHLAAGGNDAGPWLEKIGSAGAKKIRFVIDTGRFPYNTVSEAWGSVKGFDDAMYHYGDLKDTATFKVSKGKDLGA